MAYQTARTDLLDLVERGLFVSGRRGRAWVFQAVGDLQARLGGLSEGAVAVQEDSATLPLDLRPEQRDIDA